MSIENESGEIREFIHNLLHNQKTHGLLLCGSTFEMPIQYVWTNMNDMDIMYFPLDICALPADSPQTPIGFQGKILTIRDDISHPGFARLANDPLLQTQRTYILLCSYGLMYRRFFIHSSYLSQPIYAGPEYITHNNPLRYGCVVK